MADLFRGPLIVGRRDPPPQTPSGVFSVASLLVTTLALSAIPIGAQALPPVQQFPHHQYQNADTSRGSAPLLNRELPVTPVGENYQHRPPDRVRPVTDTSRGTAKTLIPDAQAPVGAGQVLSAPALLRVVSDTTRSQSVTLQAVTPPPFVPPPDVEVLRLPWIVVDTSCDTPKGLYADNQAPVGNAQTAHAPARVRPVSDTSAGSTFYQPVAVVQPPFVPPVHFRQPRFPYFYQPADTTRGTAKTLTADAQVPVQNYQHTAPDRVRPVTDTSVGSTFYQPLPATPLPPGNAVFLPAPRPAYFLADTTAESPPVAIQGVQPAPPPVVTVPPAQGGGRLIRRHYVVLIDGKEYQIRGPADAERIIKAKIKAVPKQVSKAIQKAAAQGKPVELPKPQIVVESAPEGDTGELQAQLERFAAEVQRRAEEAWQRMVDDDDEDAILLL